MTLSAEELLAGSSLTFEVHVPETVLFPSGGASTNGADYTVRLRPLTVRDLQVIARAAKESDTLVATLMVQRALVEPQMSVPEAAGMHVGLQQFLLEHVNRISGIAVAPEQVETATDAPLVKAAFVLATELGWTPEQINELTLGQILLHLQMLRERSRYRD